MTSEIVGWTIVSLLLASAVFGFILGYFNQKPVEKETDINKEKQLPQQPGTKLQ